MKIESELILGLKDGKREVLSAIYDKYYQNLYFYLLKFSSQEDIVQNAIHDMFIDLWNSRKSLGEIHSLKAYLLISSRRKLFKLTKSSRQDSLISFPNEEGSNDLLFQYAHEDFLIKQEVDYARKIEILAAINQLPPKQKESVYLRYYENLTIEEISEIQGIRYQSVLNNLQRAFDKMRNNELIISLLKAVFVMQFFFV